MSQPWKFLTFAGKFLGKKPPAKTSIGKGASHPVDYYDGLEIFYTGTSETYGGYLGNAELSPFLCGDINVDVPLIKEVVAIIRVFLWCLDAESVDCSR